MLRVIDAIPWKNSANSSVPIYAWILLDRGNEASMEICGVSSVVDECSSKLVKILVQVDLVDGKQMLVLRSIVYERIILTSIYIKINISAT